jgi:hypothetical protein
MVRPGRAAFSASCPALEVEQRWRRGECRELLKPHVRHGGAVPEPGECGQASHRAQTLGRRALDPQVQGGERQQSPTQRVHHLLRHTITNPQCLAASVVVSPLHPTPRTAPESRRSISSTLSSSSSGSHSHSSSTRTEWLGEEECGKTSFPPSPSTAPSVPVPTTHHTKRHGFRTGLDFQNWWRASGADRCALHLTRFGMGGVLPG